MLKVNKTINLNGESLIDNQVVATMYATLATEGNVNENINKSIVNTSLYEKNKTSVRKDMRAFEDLVFEEQDKLIDSNKNDKKGDE